jgi:hypothetical protein
VLIAGCGRADEPALAPPERQPPPAGAMRFAEDAECIDNPPVYRTGKETDHYSILESLGGGVALFDFDRDGHLDLGFAGGGRFEAESLLPHPGQLLRRGTGRRFLNVAALAGLDRSTHYTHGWATADFDNDGFGDVLMTGYGGLELWHGLGDGTFENVTPASGLDDRDWSTSAAWGDFNGDGSLDLYVVHYVNWSFDNDPPCTAGGRRDVCPPKVFDGLDDRVYFSGGDGTFRNVTATAGLVPGGKGLGVVSADLDLDHDLDIYVANDTTNNFLYFNDGFGAFTEGGVLSGTAVDESGNANGSMGICVLDFNRDGRTDLWVANFEDEIFALYRNDADGQFSHISSRVGLRSLGTLFVGFGTVAGDFDLDGDEDIAVANGHVTRYARNAAVLQTPLLLRNERGVLLERLPAATDSYFDTPHAGRGLAEGDLDGDGDLDLVFVNSDEPAAVVINETVATGSALSVRLVGGASNRDAIGARVELQTTAGEQFRYIVGGGSYLSTSDLAVHFGVPQGAQMVRLRIEWPAGASTELAVAENVPADGRLTRLLIREVDREHGGWTALPDDAAY